jgi:urease accessory protein
MSLPRHRWARLGVALSLAFLASGRAEAHLISTGIGPFYDGIGHFFLSPDDVIPAVAIALLAGLVGPRVRGGAIWALPLAWFVGGLAAVLGSVPLLSEQLSGAFSFLILGILIASDARIPPWAVIALAAVMGAVHGFLNGLSMREAGIHPAILQLTGVGLMLFLIVLHVSELVLSLKRPWARIVVRVAGSWIAAIGLLLLGWTFRAHR